MSKGVKDVLANRSHDQLLEIISHMSDNELITVATMTNDIELFECADLTCFDYNDETICECGNRQMLEAIVANMEDPWQLMETNLSGFGNDILFVILMESNKMDITDDLIKLVIHNDYSFGLKYLMRNYPYVDQYIKGSIEPFEYAIKSESYDILDIFYVHHDINDLNFEEIITHEYPGYCTEHVLGSLDEFGYDLPGKVMSLPDDTRKKIDQHVYAYFHNLGTYYDRNPVQKIRGGRTQKTYWNTPEEDRHLLDSYVIDATRWKTYIYYSNKLMANEKTDIIIVCLND